MSPENDNESKSLPHFYSVGFVLDNDSNTCILPGGVVKSRNENSLEEMDSSLPSGNKCWCFPGWGWNLVLLSIYNDRALIWLEPLYACMCCCNLFQFMCSSISLFSWNFLLHLALSIFCLLFWLPRLPETWGKVFTKLSNWDGFTVVCCLRYWSLCVASTKIILFTVLL